MATLKDFLQGQWLGHPLHPVLVHMPMGLWPAALVFDLFSLGGVGGHSVVLVSFWCIVVGLIVAILAVPAGIADWSGVKRERPAWKIGLGHMILNLMAAVVWAINLGLRVPHLHTAGQVGAVPVLLSGIGTLILAVGAYLGGRMVYGYGVSVARMSKQKWRKLAEAGGANVPP